MTMPLAAIPIPTYDPTDVGNQPGMGPMRVGGVDVGALPSQQENNLPSTLSPLAKRQQNDVLLVRDLAAGPSRIRAKGTVYLPQAQSEDPFNYRDRLARSVFFNVFGKTIKGLAGFIFRRDPVLGDDMPDVIQEQWENIDNAGTHGDVFVYEILQDALTTGHAAILVDYPKQDVENPSLADEDGLRPYWVPIKKENILSWRTTVEDGKTILTQVVLQESQYVPDGLFGQVEQIQYRVLYREANAVGFRLFQISKNKVLIQVDEGIYGNQIEIPLAEIPTSGRKALFESDPPLIDLAHLNIAQYQMWSDYATAMHMTCVPILFTSGFLLQDDSGRKVVIGPNTGLNSPDPAGKAEYISHNGQALGACKQALDDLKGDMSTLGIAMLNTQKRIAETEEAKRIGKADTDSALSVTARGLQDGIERALDFHARYLGLDEGGSISINRDFENMQMQADLLTAFVGAVNAGLPPRLLIEQMQAGQLINPDEDVDEIVSEMMASSAAIADQKAADQQAALEQARIKAGTSPQPTNTNEPPNNGDGSGALAA